MRNAALLLSPLVLLACSAVLCAAGAPAPPRAMLEQITDHSAGSEACGPVAVRWGFMCPIGGRFNDRLYAVDFRRTANVAWDSRTPNEAPVAFWSRNRDGRWTSVLLDGPRRTYQTPTLLLSPDGRAHVFTLDPFDSTIQWFHAKDPSNAAFTRTEIPIGWGSYMSGAIDDKGRAALVYWGNDENYAKATLGCTVVDMTTGGWRNVTIDTPGAPYCYNQVFFSGSGLHVLGVRSEVTDRVLAGTVNHYTELRYYYCPDPDAAGATWRHVVVLHNEQACLQPLGLVVDLSGRIHLLYSSVLDDGHGRPTQHRLVYAASRDVAAPGRDPQFVPHEIGTSVDGRFVLTRDGAVHILVYGGAAGAATVQHARVLDGVAGTFSPWTSLAAGVDVNRLFPIDSRNGSTPSHDLATILITPVDSPQRNSLFYCAWPSEK